MLFVDFQFFIFFSIVFLVYWHLSSNMVRKVLLLAASYIFYGFWDWRFLGLIAFSSTVDYVSGRYIERRSRQRIRRLWLTLSVVVNLSVLGFFKYFNFFRDSTAELFAALGYPINFVTLDIVLPVGISFFTFQSMSYTIDIYRRRLAAAPNPIDFYLYVAFFPQLVAGPIVRARTFLPQLRSLRPFPMKRFHMYGFLFAVGFLKKVAVGDNIAGLIDPIFNHPQDYSAAALAMGSSLYAVQIYCDFSGYTDMAIAAAGFLGFHLPRNFVAPYFARSITDFWRRWHISLSTWLRDYLYVSLGGNRQGSWKTYRNLIITMGLGGLWHGASWNFVIWGLLHGGALVVERLYRNIEPIIFKKPFQFKALPGNVFLWDSMVQSILKPTVVFVFVCLCWIFFRSKDVDQAWFITRSIMTWRSSGTQTLPEWTFSMMVLLAGLHFVFWRWDVVRRIIVVRQSLSMVLIGVVFAIALLLLPQTIVPFIYFQF
ncbi:MAG: MBOAT family protein [Desulfotignum sp.]|nr:MBOAT family protein [Desulfotignum sp.]